MSDMAHVHKELGTGWFNWVGLAQVALCAVGLTQIGWVIWAVGLTPVEWVWCAVA